jgi:hypothetical protein
MIRSHNGDATPQNGKKIIVLQISFDLTHRYPVIFREIVLHFVLFKVHRPTFTVSHITTTSRILTCVAETGVHNFLYQEISTMNILSLAHFEVYVDYVSILYH